MLSRALRRALLDTRSSLPPTFLLPWTAHLSTVSHTTDTSSAPPPSIQGSNSRSPTQKLQSTPKRTITPGPKGSKYGLKKTAAASSQNEPRLPSPASKSTQDSALRLSGSVRELLPLLQAQTPHYITAHIHGNPYLLTEGDSVRLPFLMHGVEPGDIIRLDRATLLGSRDFTLKAAAAAPKLKSQAATTVHVVDPTSGTLASHSNVMPSDALSSGRAPHFIPHIAKGKYSYVDDRLFVCRAVVTGVESEPMRIKEKTKRRNRHIRKVKSKHRYTLLKIKELRVRNVDEIEGDWTEE